jgi:hypothetical protein
LSSKRNKNEDKNYYHHLLKMKNKSVQGLKDKNEKQKRARIAQSGPVGQGVQLPKHPQILIAIIAVRCTILSVLHPLITSIVRAFSNDLINNSDND